MADDAYPYPGISQITTQQEWEDFFSAVQLDGVVAGLAPSIQSGARTASVGAGAAYLRGTYKPVTSTTSAAVPAAEGQDRIDRLVLRLDRDAVSTDTYVVPTVLKGTAGTSTPPALTQGPTGVYDLPISRWTSRSNGSLAGLVDERYGPGWFTSAARNAGLVPASPARVAVEVDTGRTFRSDGSAWTAIWTDLTSQDNLSPTSNWNTAGPCWVRRTQYGLVQITLNLVRANVAWTGADPQGSPLTRVPAAYRPQGYIAYGHTHVTPDNQARFRVEPDGWVYGDNPTRRVDPGRALRFTFIYVP